MYRYHQAALTRFRQREAALFYAAHSEVAPMPWLPLREEDLYIQPPSTLQDELRLGEGLLDDVDPTLVHRPGGASAVPGSDPSGSGSNQDQDFFPDGVSEKGSDAPDAAALAEDLTEAVDVAAPVPASEGAPDGGLADRERPEPMEVGPGELGVTAARYLKPCRDPFELHFTPKPFAMFGMWHATQLMGQRAALNKAKGPRRRLPPLPPPSARGERERPGTGGSARSSARSGSGRDLVGMGRGGVATLPRGYAMDTGHRGGGDYTGRSRTGSQSVPRRRNSGPAAPLPALHIPPGRLKEMERRRDSAG
ncbi:hypothetical protein KIPB_005769 [Kipferlia bialata]|uniref:Uncharacterized protein n=1 Tax=Kipferlia bialata TaxID=797122 RepID=A0A391NU66_9EUKA|nr:hypothetical protein KIPB_005769 [Kipferlia bialata]|eukprot:g5769.t1